MKKLLTLLLTAFSIAAFPQTVKNVAGAQVEKKALITYDLINADSILHYVALYYSTDGGRSFSSELKRTTGDVGKNVATGQALKISWDVEAELGHLQTDVVFKVTAAPTGVKGKTVIKPRVLNHVGSTGGYRVELNTSFMSGTELVLTGKVTTLTNNKRSLVMKSCTIVTSATGKTYSPRSGKLGNVGLDETAFLVRGAAMPLNLTFNVAEDIGESVDLTVCLGDNIVIKLKNILTR